MSDQIFRKKVWTGFPPGAAERLYPGGKPGHMDDSGGCHHTAGRGVRVGGYSVILIQKQRLWELQKQEKSHVI